MLKEKLLVNLTILREDDYFELNEAYERCKEVLPEVLKTRDAPFIQVIETALAVLAFRFDIDDEMQAQRDQ